MSLQKNSRATRRFGRLMKFAAWFQGLPNKMTPPPFRLIQIGSAFWQSRVLYVAARLDIATQLGEASLSAEAIATRVSAHPDAIYRLLRMLAAMGVFNEIAPKQFRNNKTSSFLRTDNPKNVRAMVLMHNSDIMSRPWYEQLERGVREGSVPFALSHGAALFDFMDSHEEFDALFSDAMESVEALLGDSYATDFDWGRFHRVIDVGGSRGGKSVSLLRCHPHLLALVVDRPHAIEVAEDYWKRQAEPAIVDRLHFQAGDALEQAPSASSEKDVYLLSAVLHGFNDEGAARVLRNVASAVGDTGATIAVLEQVLPEEKADFTGASFDMQMFMGTQGRERTLQEWKNLFDGSGLLLEEVVNLRSLAKILVLRRKT